MKEKCSFWNVTSLQAMYRLLITLFLMGGICSEDHAIAQVSSPREFEQVRSTYQSRRQELEKEKSQGTTDLIAAYVAALDRLVEQYSKAGKLDAAIAAREEKEFHVTLGISPRATNPPLELQRMQTTLAESIDHISRKFNDQLMALNGPYLKSLEPLVERFTKEQLLDAAIEVRNEMKRIEAENLAIEQGSTVDHSSMAARLASVLRIERVVDKQIVEEVVKALKPSMDQHRGTSGKVGYTFANELPHSLLNFPDSRLCFPNRDFQIPKLPVEPIVGTILAPEFRTKGSNLRIAVDGAVLVVAYQGMRVSHTDEAEAMIKSWERRGWRFLLKSWDQPLQPTDANFALIRVVANETLTFEGLGNWKQLPTLVFAPIDHGPIVIQKIE